jgi:hypothetical protein
LLESKEEGELGRTYVREEVRRQHESQEEDVERISMVV